MKTLESFTAEVKAGIKNFEEAYKTQAALTPDTYPLALDDLNEGLWFEFFIIYMSTGAV